ncbi:MAG TPA: glycoside hydrolase family 25 [Clostridiales bacterium]|nr:glycoside hydrolase family 25 [Clostridiales bacterium]
MKKIILLIFAFLLLGGIVLVILLYNSVILLNNPSSDEYPVRGVDVSSYQGKIDWNVLTKQDIDFAFIKATEGSSYIDPFFEDNYSNANKTNLRIGAYHFFSFESSGANQAKHFISVVQKTNNMLPSFVDIEFYGNYEKNPPSKEKVQSELTVLLEKLEEHYGIKPIIYATEKSYKMFISSSYQDYDIWIRDVYFSPLLDDGRKWTFWQYTNREKLDGYNGEEMFIDMNVFYGSKEEFDNYGR